MSCGICPGDRFDHGISVRARSSLYSGAIRGQEGGCGPAAQRAMIAYLQQAFSQTTQYGGQEMKIKGYVPMQGYRRATNYVSNSDLYKRPLYTPAEKLVIPRLEKLVVDDEKSLLESLVDTQEYQPLNVTNVQDRIIEGARAAQRRREVLNQIEQMEKRVA